MSLLIAATVIGRPHIESELSLGEVTIVSPKIGLALLGACLGNSNGERMMHLSVKRHYIVSCLSSKEQ